MNIHAKRLRLRLAAVLATSALVIGGFALNAERAQALSGNCSAHLVNSVGFTHATGKCTSLGKDTKARTAMDIAIYPDYHSVWFTKLNTWYKTGSWSSASGAGVPRGARVDLGYR